MPTWFQARISSLGIRLLAPLFLAIAAVLVVYAALSFRSVKENFLDLTSVEAERASELIRRATHDGMLLHRLDEVQGMLERLAEGPELAAVRVYSKAGTVALSSEPREVGRAAAAGGPCTSCHAAGAPGVAAVESSQMVRQGKSEALRHVTVIANEPGCTSGGCHEEAVGQSILGVLEVEMSLQPLEARLAGERRQLVLTTLALLLVIGGVTAVIFRRLIYRPIEVLQNGARKIADGHLETRIHVPGDHELATLAGDFNRMGEDLERMQAELRDWSETLEHKVVEKTSELREVQGQVLHMEKMASLGKLSATVAHELNNPISGILTYSRLIERDLVDQPLESAARDELDRYLHLVQQECVRCGTIVQNLMAFARRTSTELEPVDVREVVDRSVMLIRHHLEISGIELRTAVLLDNSRLIADRGQLEQALVALFVNAVEAMPCGGELSVRVREEADGVGIHVSDTGVGMDPEVLEHIFEPFYSTKQNESGAGLGLSVVYGIVHRHGGTIEVESKVGVGTTIRLVFPREPRCADDGDEDMALTGRQPAAASA
ncbi:MAG: ATP-binding protein [Longimicrobiales bacterium]|nr:ATP-binding protein [Longimicrobiales bacterium]